MGKRIPYDLLCQQENQLSCKRVKINEEMTKLRKENSTVVAKLGRVYKAKLKYFAEKMNELLNKTYPNVGVIEKIENLYSECGNVIFLPKGAKYNISVWFKLNGGVSCEDIMNDNAKIEYFGQNIDTNLVFINFYKLDIGERCLEAM